jgi:hypothetical protein
VSRSPSPITPVADKAATAAPKPAAAAPKAKANGEELPNGAVVSNAAEPHSIQGSGVRREGEESLKKRRGGSRYLNKTRKNRSKN